MTTRIPLYRGGQVVAYTVVDDDFAWLAKWRWRLSQWGYASRSYYRVGRTKSQMFMHRVVLGLEPGDPRVSDHINHDQLDNRRENLRAVTNQQNQQHRLGGKAGTASGLRGVCRGAGGRWRAYCAKRYLGSYATKELAASVAEAARREAGFLTAAACLCLALVPQAVRAEGSPALAKATGASETASPSHVAPVGMAASAARASLCGRAVAARRPHKPKVGGASPSRAIQTSALVDARQFNTSRTSIATERRVACLRQSTTHGATRDERHE